MTPEELAKILATVKAALSAEEPSESDQDMGPERQADPKIVDTLSVENLKNTGGLAALAAGMLQVGAVRSFARFEEIANGYAGAAVGCANVLAKRISEQDIAESIAQRKVGETGDLPILLARLEASQQTATERMENMLARILNRPPASTAKP